MTSSIPDSGDDAAKKQVQALTEAMERESNRSRAAFEAYKDLQIKILNGLGLNQGDQSFEIMKINLDTVFTYGQTMGESSETVLMFNTQLKLVQEMNARQVAEGKKTDERDKRAIARDERHEQLFERQVTAVEALAAATGAPKPKLMLRSSHKKTSTKRR